MGLEFEPPRGHQKKLLQTLYLLGFVLFYKDNLKLKCGSKLCLEINEIYEDLYRDLSIKYGMTPFCHLHHLISLCFSIHLYWHLLAFSLLYSPINLMKAVHFLLIFINLYYRILIENTRIITSFLKIFYNIMWLCT